MRRTALITLGLLLSLLVLPAFAQQNTGGSSRFGHGKDSIKCLLNVGIMREHVRKGEYRKAYTPWKEAFTLSPGSQACLYSDGVKILHELLRNERDTKRHSLYLEELMHLYDQGIVYRDQLQHFVRTTVRKDHLLAAKAYDYANYAGDALDLQTAYRLVQEAVASVEDTPSCYLLLTWMDVNLKILRDNPTFKPTFINDYHKAVKLIRESSAIACDINRPIWDETLARVNETFRAGGVDDYEPIVQTTGVTLHP